MLLIPLYKAIHGFVHFKNTCVRDSSGWQRRFFSNIRCLHEKYCGHPELPSRVRKSACWFLLYGGALPQTSLFRIVNSLTKIALAATGVVVAPALFAPPVYWLLHGAGEGIPSFLGEAPFHRVFSRVLLVCVLLAAWPLLASLRISNLRELGLQRNVHWMRDFSWGLLSALLPVTLLMMAYAYFGVCRIGGGIELVPFLRVICTAVGVSLLEEILFRGLLYGLSRRMMGALSSALWTSALFAIVHFIRSSGPSGYPVNVWSGFQELGRLFGSVPPLPTFLFAFATLLAIGLLLCWTLERTHSLALPIGLHVGCVFAVQTCNLFMKFQIEPPGKLPWVGPNVVSGTVPVGIFALLAVFLVFILCWKYLYALPRKTSATGNA